METYNYGGFVVTWEPMDNILIIKHLTGEVFYEGPLVIGEDGWGTEEDIISDLIRTGEITQYKVNE